MNILLITSEDNGPELSCYGDAAIQTPNLDRLASEGAAFETAHVTQAVCSPSRSSILTGLYPHQNGQIGLTTHAFSMHRQYPSVPSILKDAGYRTGRIGKLHVKPEESFPFDMVWNDSQYISFQHRDVKKTAEVAGEFFRESEQPFCLMLNYADAHLPWLRQEFGVPETPYEPGDAPVPPAVGVTTPRLEEHAANYYSCMKRLDVGIGMLMEELEDAGKLDNTLIIYLGDHGPQFSRGKGACFELAVRVPFIVRWPGMPAQGMVNSRLVSAVDILPTILDAAGLDAPDNLPGRSLSPLAAGEETDWREYLYTEWNTSHPHPPPSLMYPQRAVRDGRYKLIRTLLPEEENPVERYYTTHALVETGPDQEEIDRAAEGIREAYARWRRPEAVELYDLESDPYEFRNVAEEPRYAEIRSRLSSALDAWREETGDPLLDEGKLRQLLAEDRRVAALEGAHKKPGFRWNYLEYLYDD